MIEVKYFRSFIGLFFFLMKVPWMIFRYVREECKSFQKTLKSFLFILVLLLLSFDFILTTLLFVYVIQNTLTPFGVKNGVYFS